MTEKFLLIPFVTAKIDPKMHPQLRVGNYGPVFLQIPLYLPINLLYDNAASNYTRLSAVTSCACAADRSGSPTHAQHASLGVLRFLNQTGDSAPPFKPDW